METSNASTFTNVTSKPIWSKSNKDNNDKSCASNNTSAQERQNLRKNLSKKHLNQTANCFAEHSTK